MENIKKYAKYDPRGICLEIAKVKWPSLKLLSKNSMIVIDFTIMFGLLFVGYESLIGFAFNKIWQEFPHF